jgi:hypothetical protein
MTVFWDVVPCSLVEIDRRFRGASACNIIALMINAMSTSETSAIFYESIRRNILEDNRLYAL